MRQHSNSTLKFFEDCPLEQIKFIIYTLIKELDATDFLAVISREMSQCRRERKMLALFLSEKWQRAKKEDRCMNKIESKREREKSTVTLMIQLYCRKKHGTKKTLCSDCEALLQYAMQRSDKCPFMENKTFCSNCRVHCYKPEMREKIREVMRFSGPRMIFHHPVMAVRHVIESKKEKKRG